MRLPYLSESRGLRYAVFFLLYARQGVPAGFASTALANGLTARGVGAREVGEFVAWIGLPWTLQFAWGPVVDRFQGSSMGRRRPWVLGAQVLGLIATLPLIWVGDPAAHLGAVAWIFFGHSVIASLQDTGVDAMAISLIPDRERGRVNAFMRGGFAIGMGAGALLSLAIQARGFGFAAALQSAFLGSLALLTLVVRERPGDALLPWSPRPDPAEARADQAPGPHPTGREILLGLWRGLLAPASLRLFSAVATAYLCASLFIRAVSTHLIREGGWNDSDLSAFSGTLGTLAALAVIVAGGWLSDRVGHRRLLTGVILAMAAFLMLVSCPGPWWTDRGSTRVLLMIWSMFDPLLSVAAMPALMALCRPGVEGSQFTAYMALVNLCDVLGSYLAGRAIGILTVPTIAACCGLAALAAAASILGRSPAPADPPDPAGHLRRG